MDKPILVEDRGTWAEIVLNRPERRNAITGPLVAAFRAALAELAAAEGARAVVLRGSGGRFCSGLDLKEMNAEPPPAWRDGFQEEWGALHGDLLDFPKPLICALEGYAINAGSALALACDAIVAGEEAFLQVGEIEQGVVGPLNVAWLHLKWNAAVATALTLFGERTYGPALLRLGVAREVVPDAEVLERSRALADRLAGMPGRGVMQTKRMIRALAGVADAHAYFADARRLAGPGRAGPLPFLR